MAEDYQQQFEEDRAQQARNEPIAPTMPASFPWAMLCLAILFDLVGMIPILNLITETLAGLIFGWWQKGYAPKTDPALTFIVAKIIDVISLGILPSNIGLVIYAYLKKKASANLRFA